MAEKKGFRPRTKEEMAELRARRGKKTKSPKQGLNEVITEKL